MRCSTIVLVLTSATWVGCSSPQDVDPRSGGPTAFSYQVTFNPADPVSGNALALIGYAARVYADEISLYPGNDGVVRPYLFGVSLDLDHNQLPPGSHTLASGDGRFYENHGRPVADRVWELTQGSLTITRSTADSFAGSFEFEAQAPSGQATVRGQFDLVRCKNNLWMPPDVTDPICDGI